ncbi:MAG TPA: hypothetical protein VND22_02075 [Actinomycetota bacterium]|nr:hypothetical protein [Actinomycetota bacterium]
MRKFALITLAVLVTSCGRGSAAAETRVKDLDRIAARTALAPKSFESVTIGGGSTLRVTGEVQDDFIYHGVVEQDGQEVYEEIVKDDSRYLRLLDLDRFAQVQALDPALAALLRGEWVADPKGAPSEFSLEAASGSPPLFHPGFLLGRVRFIEKVPSIMRAGRGATEYNTDSVEYLPQDDRFRGISASVGKRFDSLPRAFDPSVPFVSTAALEPYFLYSALWIKGGQVVRVEKTLDLPDGTDAQYRHLYEEARRILQASGRASNTEAVRNLLLSLETKESYRLQISENNIVIPAPASIGDFATILVALGATPPPPQEVSSQ